MLARLQTLAAHPDNDPSAALATLRAALAEHDIVANGTLDRLIRDKRISAENATSLMNDSSYTHDIATNLLDMASVLFSPLKDLPREDRNDASPTAQGTMAVQ